MAKLVLAIGTSHSPALNSPVEDYAHHAERDRANLNHLDREGRPATYEGLLAAAEPGIAAEITPEIIARRIEACNDANRRLADAIADARPDAVIIVGDDQREQYLEDNLPAMLVYWGETIRNDILALPEDAPAYWKRARAQYHEESTPRDYPVDAPLARHLIEALIGQGFDIAQSRRLGRGCGEGHAFGFVHRRLLREPVAPVVPVVLNTYYPPNQPTPKRCYGLGRAIAAAVAGWRQDARIAIVASGGLSHFTIDEALDRMVLKACREKDAAALGSVPKAKLNAGNSEIRNWITVAGAAESLAMIWHDYQPCYRTPAGTGCGMGFAIWS